MASLAELGEQERVGQREERAERARKLYMAMTHAGQKLVLVSSQCIPESMAHLFKQVKI